MSGWNCAKGNGSGVEIDAPPQAVRVSEGHIDFAVGASKADAILAKGGPADCFIWSHFHGIHQDRYGQSDYTLCILVTDESNYPYFISGPLSETIKGEIDKPDVHLHCYAAFPPTTDLQTAVNNNNKKLTVTLKGSRKRDDWGWLTKELQGIFSDLKEEVVEKYIKGSISPENLLLILQGKSPVLS
ncbi:hypothetical protein [Paenibacillus sp. FSL H3-0469]|uniref:hypothetical protein n=1 Tax=Paenibacillus sp. FSL H3-0469 TaxID=2954506 RepID=UPI003100F319